MAKYKCIKSISVGEQDTSHFKVEVFTEGTEYPYIDGYLTDNINVKRSIDKPKFKDHFEPVGDMEEFPTKPNGKNATLIEVIENLSATLGRYEAGFKHIEQLANVPAHMGTSEMYQATRNIINVCEGLKRMPA